MPTVKELKKYCKDNNIPVMKFWNKDTIIFEIFNKTGISIELTPDELRRKESRDKLEFLRQISHETSYFTREEWIDIYGKDDLEHLENNYGKYLNFSYTPQ